MLFRSICSVILTFDLAGCADNRSLEGVGLRSGIWLEGVGLLSGIWLCKVEARA